MTSSQIVIERFTSKSLKGNPLGDTDTRSVPVYLPPGYTPNGDKYPTVYLLSSFGSRGLKLLNDELWEENIQQRMDRLITTGKVNPMLLVLPDASTRYGGSQYLNSSATGDYEDHILELVNFIDAKYHTNPNRDHRAVMGHSSGGYGAQIFGMRHADIFGLVADHAGDKYFELAYKPDFGDLLRYYERAGDEGLQNLMHDPGEALANGAPFSALATIAASACYSPNPESVYNFDFPFDLHNGELRQEIWSRWQALDPINMVPEYQEALSSLRLLYFDCGRYDEHNLLYGARIFAQKLDANKIKYTFEQFDGGHRNTKHRYDVSLTAISKVITN